MATWGLQRHGHDNVFLEQRRIRDQGPIVFMTFCMTVITLVFIVQIARVGIRAYSFVDAVGVAGFMAGFWWFLARQSCTIRLTKTHLVQRSGLRFQKVRLDGIARAFAERSGVSKSKIAWLWPSVSTTGYYTAARVRLKRHNGRSLLVRTVEPKILLRRLDALLPPDIPRAGKAWAQFGLRKAEESVPASPLQFP